MNHNLEKISPYVISERKYSTDMVYLDWNEGPDLPVDLKNKIYKEFKSFKFNHYPDLMCGDLIKSISEYTKVDADFIQIYNGSDSALDNSFRVLLNENDTVCIPYPNYSQINQTITSLGANIEYCDITTLELKINELKNLKVVYISNPNNPMGYVYDIEPLVVKYPEIFFIVDEAYYEFSKQYSMFGKAYKYPNVIVTRTFSKALSLASVRLGYLTSNSYLLSKLCKIKNFKDINQLAQISGKIILENINIIEDNISKLNDTKKEFIDTIKGVRIYDSYANFVLLEHPMVSKIISDLRDSKILVRNRSSYINNSVRITIGKSTDMNLISKVINKYR